MIVSQLEKIKSKEFQQNLKAEEFGLKNKAKLLQENNRSRSVALGGSIEESRED